MVRNFLVELKHQNNVYLLFYFLYVVDNKGQSPSQFNLTVTVVVDSDHVWQELLNVGKARDSG